MLGARSWCCCSILALWLGGACTVTVEPIKLASECRVDAACGGATGRGGATGTGGTAGSAGADAADASTAKDAAGKCTSYTGIDAEPGDALGQGLVAYYPCEQASGTALPDQSGNGRSATLASNGTGSTAGLRFAAGKVGKALFLSSASEAHVALPPGLLANTCETTIATWVYLNSRSTWQRVWTFSVDLSVYMYLTTSNASNGVLRAGITLDGNNADDPQSVQFVDGLTPLPTLVWTHVAVVLGPAGMALYVNGAQVVARASVTLRPADMGRTPNDYIGRSNFSWDPYLDGGIDEFRVYNRALSPAEIQILASGQ